MNGNAVSQTGYFVVLVSLPDRMPALAMFKNYDESLLWVVCIFG